MVQRMGTQMGTGGTDAGKVPQLSLGHDPGGWWVVYAAAWPSTGEKKKSNLCLKIYTSLELDKTP